MARRLMIAIAVACLQVSASGFGWAQEKMYPPIVPTEELAKAKSLKNPYPAGRDSITQGKDLYEGRAFCAACHAKDGTGWRKDLNYSSIGPPYAPDFTDKNWQNVRSDGELFWILKEGSHGTDMAPFLPLYLSENEAWNIIMYLRTFGKFSDKL